MKLTKKQRTALLQAYRCDDGIYADPWDGVHPRTASALVKKGLLRVDETDKDVFWLTAAGEDALGITAIKRAKPTELIAALEAAVPALLGRGFAVRSQDAEAPPLRDEGESDWSGVVAWLVYEPYMDDEFDEGFEAVEKLLEELGFEDVGLEEAREGLIGVWLEG